MSARPASTARDRWNVWRAAFAATCVVAPATEDGGELEERWLPARPAEETARGSSGCEPRGAGARFTVGETAAGGPGAVALLVTRRAGCKTGATRRGAGGCRRAEAVVTAVTGALDPLRAERGGDNEDAGATVADPERSGSAAVAEVAG